MRKLLFYILLCCPLAGFSQNENTLLLNAEELLFTGDTLGAIQGFRDVLRAYPASTGAALRLAEIYDKAEDYQKAAQYCNIVIDRILENLDLQETRLNQAIKSGDSTRISGEAYRKNIIEKDLVSLLHLRGKIRRNWERPELAERDLLWALELSPHHPGILNDLALVLMELGAPDAAVEKFKDALNADQKDIIPQFNLANLFYKIGEPDSAVFYYRQVLHLDPYHLPTLKNVAEIHYQRGFYHDALNKYNRIQELEELDYRIVYKKARIYQEKREPKNALDQWDILLENFPDDIDLFFERAKTYLVIMDGQEALKDLQIVKAVEPNYPGLRSAMAYAYLLEEEWKKAIKIAYEQTKEHPDYAPAYLYRAIGYANRNRKRKACKNLESAYTKGIQAEAVPESLISLCK